MNRILIILFSAGLIMSCSSSIEKQYKADMVENPTTQSEIDKNKIIEHLMTNGIEAQATATGIYYTIEKAGEGDDRPDSRSTIKAHYTGTTLDGTKFDSSVDRGQPLEFRLGGVIRGWQEAIPMLAKGGKGTFYIPSSLAYGPRGAGQLIGPNEVLIFDIELIDFTKAL
jgi:FKBP-type peptidyl-prolyl cis-trans isomerase